MKLLDMLASQNLHDQCPRLKVCAKTNNSKNAQNPQKTATIGTLSLVFRVSRAPIIKMWCLSQQLDKILLPKKISRRNIEKSPRYSQKTSKIMDILYTTPPIMVMWQRLPELIKFWKLFKKLSKRILITLAKNHIDCICSFFHEFLFHHDSIDH